MAESTEKGNSRLIRDLTTGSVPGTLLRFAAPLFLSGLLQMVYNMVDMIVVGQMVGTNGLSSVSIGGEMMMLITFIAMGFSNAGQILISRYVGEQRHDLIGKMVATLFTLLLSLAVVIMLLFLLTYQDIMAWLNTPDSIWEYTRQYSIICILGTVFIYGYNLVSAILRGMGDSKHPFMFIAVASVLNLVLDLLFVGPMKMGPGGAALATVIGQSVSFLFALVLLYRHRDQIYFDFRPSHFRIAPEVIRPLLSLGIPMVIQSAAITFSMLFVNSYINRYGEVHIAVTGIARKLENMISIVSQAISAAGGAMVSQALGAGKTKRVPKIVGHALWIVAIPSAVFALVTLLKPEWLFGIFSQDPAVLQLVLEQYIPVAMIQYLGCTLRPPSFALINGSGNSKLNLAVALLDGVACRIGLSLLLGVTFSWGISGFWYGNAVSGCVPFVIGFAFLLSGRWKAPKRTVTASAGKNS
ncbi:MAG: MATE family efflux transporter [Clostridia bacterium]|nr:MATE family efflux transporter [Clostridia bacterium]